MNLFRSLSLVACAALLCSAVCAPPPEPPDDGVPVARLVMPQLHQAGAVALLDGSASGPGSADSDSEIFLSINPGDGSEVVLLGLLNDGGVHEHLYSVPGSYEVVLTAEDEDGDVAEASAQITVVADDNGAVCDCELPCFDDGVCTDRGCLVWTTSSEELEALPFDDDIACPNP